MDFKKPVPYLLAAIIVLLAVLVPGGPVETRSFSNLSPRLFWGFNAFLISLGIFTLITLFFVVRKKKWSYIAAIVTGVLYILVYILDLAHIFPVSPDPMSTPLLWIEVIDTVLAAICIAFAAKSLEQYDLG